MDEQAEHESRSGLGEGALRGGIGYATLKRVQDDLFGLVHTTARSEIKGAYLRLLPREDGLLDAFDEIPKAATISATCAAVLGPR